MNELVDYVKGKVVEACSKAILKDKQFIIQNVFNLDSDLCLEMIKRDGLVLRCVNNKTSEMCYEAVEQNREALIYVNEEEFPDVHAYYKLLWS